MNYVFTIIKVNFLDLLKIEDFCVGQNYYRRVRDRLVKRKIRLREKSEMVKRYEQAAVSAQIGLSL